MKVIICEKLKEMDKDYYKRSWRTPHEELENIGWICISINEIKNSKKKLSEFFIDKYGLLPTVILFWHINTYKLIETNFDEIITNNWVKCLYMDDLHSHDSWTREMREKITKHFDYIFTTYAYIFTKYFPKADPKKIVWYPHNINNKFRVEINKNPINKILLSGAMDKHYYPFRCFMMKLANKYPIDRLGRLAYSKGPNHEFFGINYIKYLNKYLIAFTCCSIPDTPYIVNKFFEIPASGALLLAYDEYVKQPLENLGFIDGVNYISINKKNAIHKINYVTNPKNRPVIDRIRKNGYYLVWNNHTLLDRIKIIENVVNGGTDKIGFREATDVKYEPLTKLNLAKTNQRNILDNYPMKNNQSFNGMIQSYLTNPEKNNLINEKLILK